MVGEHPWAYHSSTGFVWRVAQSDEHHDFPAKVDENPNQYHPDRNLRIRFANDARLHTLLGLFLPGEHARPLSGSVGPAALFHSDLQQL